MAKLRRRSTLGLNRHSESVPQLSVRADAERALENPDRDRIDPARIGACRHHEPPLQLRRRRDFSRMRHRDIGA